MTRGFCLLVPADLANQTIDRSLERGWLRGVRNVDEWVFVAFGAELDADHVLWSDATQELAVHRSVRLRDWDGRLVPWVVVRPGFQSALRTRHVCVADDLLYWARQPSTLDEICQGDRFLCCVEHGENGPLVSFVYRLPPAAIDQPETIFELDVEVLSRERRVLARLDGLLPLDTLRRKRATVVGLGSGGGAAAFELAAAGVGELHLFDKGRLTVANLFRHVCGKDHLGRSKANAVADLIRDHDLPAVVFSHAEDVLASADEFRTVAASSDIVLGATDTPISRALVNYVCVKVNTPMILAATFDSARIGEIIRVLPDRTACYECVRLHLADLGSLVPDASSDGETLLPYATQDAPFHATLSSGLGADVKMVASLQARVAIMTMLGDTHPSIGFLPRNYITWGSTRSTAFQEPFSFPHPFTAKFVDIPRRADCPVCGPLPEEFLQVDVNAAYEAVVANLHPRTSE